VGERSRGPQRPAGRGQGGLAGPRCLAPQPRWRRDIRRRRRRPTRP
jgi:hypothetical protein